MDQVMAVVAVRPIREIRVVSRSRESREGLRGRLTQVLGSEIAVTLVADPDTAVEGADVICCATPSTTPLFDPTRVGDGVHINAVGAFRPTMCELPAELLKRASVIAVDEIGAAMDEAGDILQAIESGHITKDRLVELGSLLEGGAWAGSAGPTVFKSVGIAVQDWAIADLVRSRVAISPPV